jgi:hypothetical protein
MASEDPEAPTVVDNPDESRYEIWADGKLAGFAQYRTRPGRLVFVHTETEPGFEGRGMASHLVRAALDDVRSRHLGVTALCPFVSAFIRDHPEYADLLVTTDPSRR